MSDGEKPARIRSAARRFALDLTPLRVSRDYRLLWTGQFVSELGYQFARVAIYVQVFELTGSTAAVGLTGLTGLIALFAGSLVGSSFIDAHDRRSILMGSQVFMVLSAAILLAGAVAGRPAARAHLRSERPHRVRGGDRAPGEIGDDSAVGGGVSASLGAHPEPGALADGLHPGGRRSPAW